MKLVRTSITIPQNVLDAARIKAATEQKSLSRYITDELKAVCPVHKKKVDLSKVVGVIDSGKPDFEFPSRDELYQERWTT